MIIRLFKHNIPLPFVFLAVVEGLIFFSAPFLAVSWLEGASFRSEGAHAIRPYQALLFAGITLLSVFAVGLYNPRQRIDFTGQLVRVMVCFVVAVLVLAAVLFLGPELNFGRDELLLTAAFALFGSLLARLIFHQSVHGERFKRQVLVYGAGRQATNIASLRRRSDQRGFRLVGYVPAIGDQKILVPSGSILNPRESLIDYCVEHGVDEIVVAMDDRRHNFPMRELLECRLDGIEVTEVLDFFERETGKVQLDVLNPSWMIFSKGFQRGRLHATFERTFDILVSLLLLSLAWPVMLATALAIMIEDGPRASVLYRQIRVGQFGKLFRLMKFRSMGEGAEDDGKPRWAEHNDGRMTRVGALIRRLRIDELPQVLNVLRGDMSFVGPRPERPEFVVDLEQRVPFYRERHNLKPGITGWAQLCYPYGSSEKDAREKLQYDLYYVKNHTLLFYLAILVQTVEVVVWAKGAR